MMSGSQETCCWSKQSGRLAYKHDAGCGHRAPLAANLVDNEAQADHAGKQAGHLGVVQSMQEGCRAINPILQPPACAYKCCPGLEPQSRETRCEDFGALYSGRASAHDTAAGALKS